jgi:hypothetical protein
MCISRCLFRCAAVSKAGVKQEKDFAAFRQMALMFLYPFEYNSADRLLQIEKRA